MEKPALLQQHDRQLFKREFGASVIQYSKSQPSSNKKLEILFNN